MAIKLLTSIALLMFSTALAAQELSPETISKREKRKNITIKEWNTDAKSKTRWMDHYTVYDDQGRKVEEAEFSTYGLKYKIVIRYREDGFIDKEIVYNDRNKVERIRKYEYNPDGTKKKQYNYLPNGKLYSIKIFEYIATDKE